MPAVLVKDDLQILKLRSEMTTEKRAREIVPDMISIAQTNNGIGLSAIQIGYPLRVCVVRSARNWFILLNPEIEVVRGTGRLHILEKCLSLTDVSVLTDRAEEIIVRDEMTFLNPTKVSGITSVIIQHEVDHLNGILITDREWKRPEPIGRNERIIIEKNGERRLCKFKELNKFKVDGWEFLKLENAS